jgi:hypothetical protein
MGRRHTGCKTDITAWRELGVHDDAAVLPMKLAQKSFGATATVHNCGVNFIVAVLLEDVEDCRTLL